MSLNTEAVVNPFEVKGATVDGKVQEIDYNKLVEQFGTQIIEPSLLERFEKLTGHKPHPFLRRGLFYSHRFSLCLS
jgi:tryptophanyl-tRNA synthetase